MSASSKFLGGFVFGTAVGVVTGLLMAPSSGNQTRRNIMNRSKVYSQQAIDAVRQYLENIKKQGKNLEETAYEKGKEVLDKLNEPKSPGTYR